MSEGTLALSKPAVRSPLMRTRSDAQLTKLASRGSRAAFTTIYERHHQALYRYCRTILGNDHDALDALQSTMASAYEALAGETRELALKPWLFRIAHNEAISLVRKRRPDSDLDSASAVAAPELDPETRMRAQRLFTDLEMLTERQRASLVMRELSGLEFSDIGDALDTTAQGAKQSVYEARMALVDLERGREMSCDEICGRISADDRRRRQSRVVRSHLKTCSSCSTFAAQMDSRRETLAAIAPPLAAPIALGLLHGILGGSGGGGSGAAIGGGGAALGFGGGFAAKAATVAIIAAGASGVAIEASKSNDAEPSSRSSESSATQISGASQGAGGTDSSSARSNGANAGNGSSAASRDNSLPPDGHSARNDHANAAGAGGNGAAGNGNQGESAAAGGAQAGNSEAATAAAAAGPGNSGNAPGQGDTPPGQAQTPPGQAQTPPGQAETPPGQSETPPAPAGTPPGHGGTPPGQALTPPGQAQTPPGQAQTPSEQAQTPPGQSQTPPGQSQTPPGQGPKP